MSPFSFRCLRGTDQQKLKGVDPERSPRTRLSVWHCRYRMEPSFNCSIQPTKVQNHSRGCSESCCASNSNPESPCCTSFSSSSEALILAKKMGSGMRQLKPHHQRCHRDGPPPRGIVPTTPPSQSIRLDERKQSNLIASRSQSTTEKRRRTKKKEQTNTDTSIAKYGTKDLHGCSPHQGQLIFLGRLLDARALFWRVGDG